MTTTRTLACSVLTAITTAVPSAAPQPALETVLQRAGAYVGLVERGISAIVAEERYVQDVRHPNAGRFAADSHRELRSDVLLVRPGGTDRYVEFRDVFEVDGARIRDRQDRLTALFLDPTASAGAQIQRINRGSARYNIGNIARTINTPTLALLFLLPQNQARFRFTGAASSAPTIARAAAAPGGAWVVEYEEIQHPTLIRTTTGLDLPARGFDGLLTWVLELRRELGIPHALADLGVTADKAEVIGREAAIDPSAGGNPIPLPAATLERIFMAAVRGDLGASVKAA